MKINWFKIDKQLMLDLIRRLMDTRNDWEYSYFLLYLKQGKLCIDCNNYFYDCNCSKCNYCYHPMCICDLMQSNIYLPENVKKHTIELTKKILSFYENKLV